MSIVPLGIGTLLSSVHPILDKRSVQGRARPADHRGMQDIMHIVDSDERSLAARVDAAVAALGGQAVVSRFTLWYTTRPPVHQAVLRAVPEPKPLP
jgi:hypothetical protein